MTKDTYLELTYRHGKLLAGYLYLPRNEGEQVARSQKASQGLVVDYASDDRPIGIEIVSPSIVTPGAIMVLLQELRCEEVSEAELAPLLAG